MCSTQNLSDSQNLLVVPLHRYPEYKEDIANILNKEWPRSRTLRYRSLDSSCDELPTGLVLIKRGSDGSDVLGYARLNVIPNEENSVWIESVIIHHDKRGQGFGSVLMTKTEEYAAALGFKNAVLSTHGVENFYKKLGYEFCSPVCLYGGLVNRHLLPKPFLTRAVININKSPQKSLHDNDINHNSDTDKIKTNNSSHIIPPPPPLPQSKRPEVKRIDNISTKLYMRKTIT